MSTIYLVTLIGVAVALLYAIADVVVSLSRRPVWERPAHRPMQLAAVETVERREQQLPFVGADRRLQPQASHTEQSKKAA